jgi:two-component system, NtrC family, sensor kinase
MAANTMSQAPPPSSEKARLASLMSYAVLDTGPAPGFDELTALAADIFGTPIALVSLIDSHRQWFKSRHGLTTTETSRDLVFCAHTILCADPRVVTDLRTDARFANHPMVLGDPHIGFYAGMPLINEDEHTRA